MEQESFSKTELSSEASAKGGTHISLKVEEVRKLIDAILAYEADSRPELDFLNDFTDLLDALQGPIHSGEDDDGWLVIKVLP
jgi:hypothetical protein